MTEFDSYLSAGVDREQAKEVVASLKLSTDPFGSVERPGSGVAMCVSMESLGTKALLLAEAGLWEEIGWDAAAMAINDVTARGVETTFLLDHVMVDSMRSSDVRAMIHGVMSAAQEVGARVIGGEIAQLSGLMSKAASYVSVTAIGFADAPLPLRAARPGDAIVGFASSGPHANGYSLIRKSKLSGEDLLTRSRIYRTRELGRARSAAHITGGGLAEKCHVMLGIGTRAVVDPARWQIPEVFSRIQRALGIRDREMWRIFNMGIGMAACVPSKEVGCDQVVIGEVLASNALPCVEIIGVE